MVSPSVDDLVTSAITEVQAAVVQVRDALDMERKRITYLPMTTTTADARNESALAVELLTYRCNELTEGLRNAGSVLGRMRTLGA